MTDDCRTGRAGTVFTISQVNPLGDQAVFDDEDGRSGCRWGSSCGYEVGDDGWILDSDEDRILMLPPPWQSESKVHRVWNGKFLALLLCEQPTPVILELEP